MNKQKLSDLLDNLVDADGFKTDLTFSIPRANLLEISLYLTGTAAVSSLIYFIIKMILDRK